MTFDKCCGCAHAFIAGKKRLYCTKALADKDDCGEYEETVSETSIHHLICAFCDNVKCVRGTKECEFEQWKEKQKSEERE